MKRFVFFLIVLTETLSVKAQQYGSWYSSVTEREYGVTADSVRGSDFDCLIYGQSLYKYIPIVGCRISSQDIPAFVEELRALSRQAEEWWQTKAPITGIEDAGTAFHTNFRNVTAWFDMGTPPEPQYHNMEDAHVEAYAQMRFLGEGYVCLSIAPITDRDGNRHPGFILPFGSIQEINSFASAVENLNPGSADEKPEPW